MGRSYKSVRVFSKTQGLDQLETRVDRLESVRQKSNVQRQAMQKNSSSQQTSCQFGEREQALQSGLYVQFCLNGTAVNFLLTLGQWLLSLMNVYSTTAGGKLKVWGEFDSQFQMSNKTV